MIPLKTFTFKACMDCFTPETQKYPSKCNKKRLTHAQVHLLEMSFTFNKKLDSDRKFQLAQELSIPPRQIAIWYQNKRARWKNQNLEFDHNSLKERLDNALVDNKKLEKEVERLREELYKAQNMLPYNYSSVSTLSNSCEDQDGSTSTRIFDHDDSKNKLENELYACLIGKDQSDHQFGKSDDRDIFGPSISL